MIIALLFEIGIVTASLILNEEIIESLGTTLTQELVDYNVTSNGMKFYDDSNPMTIDLHHVDFLQIHLKCCGVKSYKDWENNQKLNETKSVPDSCCKTPAINCGLNAMNMSMNIITSQDSNKIDINRNIDSIYTIGCEHESKDTFEKNILIVSLIAVGVLGLQIFAIILSWCLSDQMKNKRWWGYRYSKAPYNKRNYY